MSDETRGTLNFNPGNIRHSPIAWQGMAEQQPDPSFVTFKAAHWGIRALALVLLTYYRKHGLNTVRGIINRWAPPEDANDTPAYVADVAARVRVISDSPIKVDDPVTLCKLVAAIIQHENGSCVYTPVIIANAVDEALGREMVGTAHA